MKQQTNKENLNESFCLRKQVNGQSMSVNGTGTSGAGTAAINGGGGGGSTNVNNSTAMNNNSYMSTQNSVPDNKTHIKINFGGLFMWMF
jgi:hypothetical protein